MEQWVLYMRIILPLIKLQNDINQFTTWLKYWRIKSHGSKSTYVTFAFRRDNYSTTTRNTIRLQQAKTVKYLVIHLDRKLPWRNHIFTEMKQLGTKFNQMYWLLGRKSYLSTESKLLLYKTTFKSFWACGISLWGLSGNSIIEIHQRFQNKVLRAPWYTKNDNSKEKITKRSNQITRWN